MKKDWKGTVAVIVGWVVVVVAVIVGWVVVVAYERMTLAAQTPTQVPTRELRAGTAGVLVSVPGQGIFSAQLGTGLSITGTGSGPYTIQAVTPPGPTRVVGETYFPSAPQLAFPLANTPVSGTLEVFYNGIRMSANADYSIAGSTVTFVAAQQPGSGDTVAFDYYH